VDPAAQLADGIAGAQQRLHRKAAHGQDHLGLQQLDLPLQEGQALRHFFRTGIAVAWRPAFQHVDDIDLGPAVETEGAQHVVQKLARRTDEGLPALVLRFARRFADDQPVRLPVPDAEHGLGPAGTQRARLARRHGSLQRVPRHGIDAGGCGRRWDGETDRHPLGRQDGLRGWRGRRRRHHPALGLGRPCVRQDKTQPHFREHRPLPGIELKAHSLKLITTASSR